ncbi:MAG: SusD/RagB family nutrient-binding outer membrane lipoprotein [Chitinophagaceae bacterium]
MKRNILSIPILLLAFSASFIGCKKSEIDDAYYNPNGSIDADVQRLYSGLFFNEKVIPRYWNLYTFHIPMMGTYSQASGYTNGENVYEQATNYTSDRWSYYYTTTIARYRELEKYYQALETDGEKEGFKLFMETAKIFFYDQTAQIIDLWGDIPFSTAGQLNTQGKIVLATYDDAKTVYTDMLNGLKETSDYLAGVTPETFYLTQLQSYDYINKGSLLKWRKYCNSLILRLAMRMSYSDEATAKALVTTILGDATKYPLVDAANESIVIQPASITSNLVAQNDIRNGFGVNPFAPGKMVNDVMLPSADPRLEPFFTKNASGTYKGVSNTLTAAQVTAGITAGEFSRWDSTTFSENNLFPGILITAPEVSFLKAEAYERWGLGGNAKTAYETGIRQSIDFWFSINSGSSYTAAKDTKPTELEILAFLAKPGVLYGTDNLAKIATQKWIDFSIMQANQAWAEYRRTKLPALSFPVDNTSPNSPNPPNRLTYPSSERSLNTANYEAVKAKDLETTKIFWDVK